MSISHSMSKFVGLILTLGVLLVTQATTSLAQLPVEVARQGYADAIFVNGNIVSMDDVSASTEAGSVYQAIAVKNTRIMKLGNNQEVRALAGPDTRIYDLKGRTLIPGIIEPGIVAESLAETDTTTTPTATSKRRRTHPARGAALCDLVSILSLSPAPSRSRIVSIL